MSLSMWEQLRQKERKKKTINVIFFIGVKIWKPNVPHAAYGSQFFVPSRTKKCTDFSLVRCHWHQNISEKQDSTQCNSNVTLASMENGSVFYDQGLVVFIHKTIFSAGNNIRTCIQSRNYFTIYRSSKVER